MNAHSALKSFVMAGVIAAQATIAGSAINPVPIKAGDQCFRCQRVIADPWVAGEVIGKPTDMAYKFRTIRCMITHLKATEMATSQIYVADTQTAKLVDIDHAAFVPVVIDEYTGFPGYGLGKRDYVAFRSLGAAEQFAAERGVKTMSWAAVVYEVALLDDTADHH